MSKFSLELTQKQIDNVINELGLSGYHPNDKYIAAYHIYEPDKIGCDNYTKKLTERNEAVSNGYTHTKTVKRRSTDDTRLRNECDAILCGFENGDISKLSELTKKQCTIIKDLILNGLSGTEEYFVSVEDLEEQSPEYFYIYKLVDSVMPKRKVDKKKIIERKLNAINLSKDIGSIVTKVDDKVLFDEKYSTFVIYNKKQSNLIIVKCGDVDSRFKGSKTLLGEITKYRVNSKIIPKLISLRSVNKIVDNLPIRKPQEVNAVQLNNDCVLLKVFK